MENAPPYVCGLTLRGEIAMAVQFSDEATKQAVTSLQRYCTEDLDIDLTGIQGTMLLNFILAEIAPTAYNAGVAAAEAFLRDRLADLAATCYEPEFAYWPKGVSVRRNK
jgi:uncharacterized protein (DUF2164 family)